MSEFRITKAQLLDELDRIGVHAYERENVVWYVRDVGNRFHEFNVITSFRFNDMGELEEVDTERMM